MKRRMVLGKLTRCSGVCFGRIKEYSQVSNGKRLMERELREASEMVGEEHCCISGRGGSGVSGLCDHIDGLPSSLKCFITKRFHCSGLRIKSLFSSVSLLLYRAGTVLIIGKMAGGGRGGGGGGSSLLKSTSKAQNSSNIRSRGRNT
ncbi:uncharacterized protein LOC125368666 isoform X2 [Ricinus communis]|uniref:uncharacterized protein LOC125368666 isoform X2 n=1 Tax=Ricinus communis TaxID=3988 RepID=UPI00201B12B0|nr:uncharacterized protein LOC125368666 isoform X2 [Ricinus communis]